MNRSDLQGAVINYVIDMYANAIRVIGIKGILEGNDKEQIAKLIIEFKKDNYDMISEMLDDFNYNLYQRTKVIEALDNESNVSVMMVNLYYNDYNTRNRIEDAPTIIEGESEVKADE